MSTPSRRRAGGGHACTRSARLWAVLASSLAALPLLPAVASAQCGGGGGGSAAGSAQTARMEASRVVSEYDRREEMTVVRIGPVGSETELRVAAAFACPGKTVCRPGIVQLTLAAEGRGPRLEDDHALTLSAGEESWNPAGARYRMEGKGRGVVELVSVNLPAAAFLALSRAERVAWRLGPLEGALTEPQLAALGKLAERIDTAEVPR